VVRTNLKNSFPEKSNAELRIIEKKFYRHLCDSLIEMVTQYGFSKEEYCSRFKLKNLELVESYYNQGRDILIAAGHYANWEWVITSAYLCKYIHLGIYKKMSNKWINKMVIKIREKTGGVATEMEEVPRKMKYYRDRNIRTMTYFVVDQRPLGRYIQYWTRFMNQDAPVYLGIEKLARKLNSVVIFLKVKQLKRGYYEAEFIPITENASATAEYEITEKHVRLLESVIREEPEFWMWSHRRWKHKKPVIEANKNS
jgi:KDO2-lipid IV(A) lauroyltransferase